MKKSLSRKTRTSLQSFWIKTFGVSLGITLILYLSIYVFSGVGKGVANFALRPLERLEIISPTQITNLGKYFTDRRNLLLQIEDLEWERAQRVTTNSTLVRLQNENDEFRKLLDVIPRGRLAARVVAKPPKLAYDYLLLDKGAEEGVIENAPVFTGADQLVGFVTDVKPHTALVTLITTPNFKATAYIIGPNIFTETEGQGNGVLQVRVPQGVVINEGDVVVLPAVASGVYGEIFSVKTNESEPYRTGYVSPEFSLQSLYYVSIGVEAIDTTSYQEARDLIKEIKEDLLKVELPHGVLVTPEQTTSTASSTSEQTDPASNQIPLNNYENG